MTESQLVGTVADVQKQLESLVLELDAIEGAFLPRSQRAKLLDTKRRLAQIAGRLGVALVAYESGAVIGLPDHERTR